MRKRQCPACHVSCSFTFLRIEKSAIWQTPMLFVPWDMDPPRLGPLLTNDILLPSRINLSVLAMYEHIQHLWQ